MDENTAPSKKFLSTKKPFTMKRRIILAFVIYAAALLMIAAYPFTNDHATVSATFYSPSNANVYLTNVSLGGLNDVDGQPVYWSPSHDFAYEVPTGDIVTSILVTARGSSPTLDAWQDMRVSISMIDSENEEIFNYTYASSAWVRSGYLDSGVYYLNATLPNLSFIVDTVGTYTVMANLYYYPGD